MSARRSLTAALLSLLFLAAGAPREAQAANQWFQQAILLVHLNLGGGQFFTTNYVFAATDGAVSVNVKCFNDAFQRIGPPGGINVPLSSAGQIAQHTPTTLGVTTDALFANGVGWCWASSIQSGLDFSSQVTVGVTSTLTPGALLTSPGAMFTGTSSGLAETSSNTGGVPYFTTSNGAQSFLILINPLLTAQTLTLKLSDVSGNPQGQPLSRLFQGRALSTLPVPGSFGLALPPTSGSVSISATGAGYLGWYLQILPNGGAIFTPVNIDGDFRANLPQAAAP